MVIVRMRHSACPPLRSPFFFTTHISTLSYLLLLSIHCDIWNVELFTFIVKFVYYSTETRNDTSKSTICIVKIVGTSVLLDRMLKKSITFFLQAYFPCEQLRIRKIGALRIEGWTPPWPPLPVSLRLLQSDLSSVKMHNIQASKTVACGQRGW